MSQSLSRMISCSLIDMPNEDLFPPDMDHDPEETQRNLEEGIAGVGLIHPISVRPHPEKDGRFILICGRHRLAAVRKSSQGKIECKVFDVDERTAITIAFSENSHRKNATVGERLILLKGFVDCVLKSGAGTYGHGTGSQKRNGQIDPDIPCVSDIVAKANGTSRARAHKKIKAALGLSIEQQFALDAAGVSISGRAIIASIKDQDSRAKCIDLIVHDGLSIKEAAKAVGSGFMLDHNVSTQSGDILYACKRASFDSDKARATARKTLDIARDVCLSQTGLPWEWIENGVRHRCQTAIRGHNSRAENHARLADVYLGPKRGSSKDAQPIGTISFYRESGLLQIGPKLFREAQTEAEKQISSGTTIASESRSLLSEPELKLVIDGLEALLKHLRIVRTEGRFTPRYDVGQRIRDAEKLAKRLSKVGEKEYGWPKDGGLDYRKVEELEPVEQGV